MLKFPLIIIAMTLAGLIWMESNAHDVDRAVVEAKGSTVTDAAKLGTPGVVRSSDPAVELLRKISDEDFERPTQVATGRLLNRIDTGVEILERVNLNELRVVRRTADWVRIESPALVDPTKTAWIRVVREGRGWKVENVRWLD